MCKCVRLCVRTCVQAVASVQAAEATTIAKSAREALEAQSTEMEEKLRVKDKRIVMLTQQRAEAVVRP